MTPIATAVLTWNLLRGTLFIGLPSYPVEEVCIEDVLCLTPENSVVIAVPWDGPPPVVRARSGETWVYAVPVPDFVG